MSIVSLSNRNITTTERAIIINNKVDCFEIALSKSLMITVLKERMAHGIVHFLYQKIDGSIREAYGTTHHAIAKTNVDEVGTKSKRKNVTAYWDVNNEQWRCFRWENFIGILNS